MFSSVMNLSCLRLTHVFSFNFLRLVPFMLSVVLPAKLRIVAVPRLYLPVMFWHIRGRRWRRRRERSR
jgi:hypothetical protein